MLAFALATGMAVSTEDGEIVVIPMPIRRAVIVRIGTCWRIKEHGPGEIAAVARALIALEVPAEFNPDHVLWVPALTAMGQCPVFLEALAVRSMVERDDPEAGRWLALYQTADSYYAEAANIELDSHTSAEHIKTHWDEAAAIVNPRIN